MNHYAVVGNPIAHSLSPLIHHWFAQQTGIALQYDKIAAPLPLFESTVHDFFKQPHRKGLNITLPFKERAFTMADSRTPRCIEAGAANTLWMEEGLLMADNTDGIGLIRDLHQYLTIENKTILILGAGGAARGILGSLFQLKPKALILSNRTMDKVVALTSSFPNLIPSSFDDLTGRYDLIINATSASLQGESLPLPDCIFHHHPFCYDLAYSKTTKTAFVQWAMNHGCKAIDGMGMLIEQAAEAFYIWHQVKPDTIELKRFVRNRNSRPE